MCHPGQSRQRHEGSGCGAPKDNVAPVDFSICHGQASSPVVAGSDHCHFGTTAEIALFFGWTRCPHPGHLACIKASAVPSPSIWGSAMISSSRIAIFSCTSEHKYRPRVPSPVRSLRAGMAGENANAPAGKARAAAHAPADLSTTRRVMPIRLADLPPEALAGVPLSLIVISNLPFGMAGIAVDPYLVIFMLISSISYLPL